MAHFHTLCELDLGDRPPIIVPFTLAQGLRLLIALINCCKFSKAIKPHAEH